MKRLDLRLLRSMKDSLGRFIAVASVIMVGLVIYTAMNMAAINLESSIDEFYNVSNFADITVQLMRVPEAKIDDLLRVEGVEAAEGRIVFDVPLDVGDDDEKVTVRVVSVPTDGATISTPYIVDGNSIKYSNKDVLVIRQFAEGRDYEVGQEIRPQMGGRMYSLSIRGIAASPEYIYLMENEQSLLPQSDKFGVIYMADDLAASAFGMREGYNEVLVAVADGYDVDAVKRLVEKRLERYGVKRVITANEQLSNRMVSEEIKGLHQMSSSMPVVFLTVAAIIMGVMIARMVRNDRMAIGVLKALGHDNIAILNHYTKYSLLVGTVGALLGVTIGTVLSGYMAKMYTVFFSIPMLKVVIYYRYIFGAILLSALFSVIAGLLGARRVLSYSPAESMRPPSPKSGKRIMLERFKFIWRRLTFSWKMAVRNILRSKKRFAFVTTGIALSTAILILPCGVSERINSIFNDHYGSFMCMDYNVNFSHPVSYDIIHDLRNVADATLVELKVEYPFEITYGHRSKVVSVIGLEQETTVYNFVSSEGNTINIPLKGILLSEGLASYLGVTTGDYIELVTFVPGRDDVIVEVKGIVQQSLGINAYMNMDYMWTTVIDSGMVTGVYMNSHDDVTSKLSGMRNIASVQSLSDMRGVFEEFTGLIVFGVGMMTIFGGILSFAVVYTTTVMGIEERRLELSSLRVMGFFKREIYKMITKENLIMTIAGIIIGLPLGAVLLKFMEEAFSTEIYHFDMSASPLTLAVTAVVTVAFTGLAQLATFRRIKKLDFIEALKNRIS